MTKKILVIAAHPDDEVLGCGGTIAKHVRNNDEVYLLVLTDGEFSRAAPEIDKRAQCLSDSCRILGISQFKQLSFKDNQLDAYPLLEIIKEIEAFSKDIKPQIIYTHLPTDMNQDHRVAYLAALTAFRPQPGLSVEKILTFEIPSSTEWSPLQAFAPFAPNYFESLSQEDMKVKFEALRCYAHELRDFPHPRSLENIKALQMVRGTTVGVAAAEAFFLERFISQ
jgi:LmbE family N-acetylglucosaminyl deacetylase